MAYVGVTNLSTSQGGAADMLYAVYGAMVSASWSCLGSGGGSAGGYSSSGSLVTAAATFNSNGAWVRMREPSGAGGREYILMRGSSALNAVIKYSRSTGFTGGAPAAAVCPTTAGGDGRVILGSGTDATATIAASGSALLDSATGYVHCVASDTANNGVYGFWAMKTAPASGILGSFFCQEGVQVGSTNAADQDPSWRAVAGSAAVAADWWSLTNGTCSWWEKYNLAGSTYRTSCSMLFPGYIASNGYSYSHIGGIKAAFPYGGAEIGRDPYEPEKATFISGMLSKWTGAPCIWPKGYTTGIQIGSTSNTLLDVFNYSSSEPRIVINTTIPLVMPWITNVTPVI